MTFDSFSLQKFLIILQGSVTSYCVLFSSRSRVKDKLKFRVGIRFSVVVPLRGTSPKGSIATVVNSLQDCQDRCKSGMIPLGNPVHKYNVS